MSDNRFQFEGLGELIADLRSLPVELRDEGGEIVAAAAEGAADAIRAGYEAHRRSGNLAEHVVVEHHVIGDAAAVSIVRSTAKHAYIFENGTELRHTDLGLDRGAARPGNVFIPAIMRARRAMYLKLKALLTQKGLVVSGDA